MEKDELLLHGLLNKYFETETSNENKHFDNNVASGIGNYIESHGIVNINPV